MLERRLETCDSYPIDPCVKINTVIEHFVILNLAAALTAACNEHLFLQGAGSDRTGGTEEESELTGNLPADDTHGWNPIIILLDRVCFIVFTLVYLFLFARCLM
jgi:predicted small secreted protein